MNKKRSLRQLFGGVFVCLVVMGTNWAVAEEPGSEYRQGFEEITPQFFQPVGGKASEGSALGMVATPIHGGKQALKLSYTFSGAGYVEFNLTSPPVVAKEADRLKFSLWCYGAGKADFGPMGLRLVDSGGETFQYTLGESSIKALNGTGWREITATIDLSKPEISWGLKKEGVPRYPLHFLGFGLGNQSAQSSKGEIVLDDVSFTRIAEGAPAVQPATLSLEPVLSEKNKELFFYAPGSRVAIQVQATNLPPTVHRFRWESSNFEGARLHSGDLVLDAQKKGLIEIPRATQGITYVTAAALNERGDILVEGDTRFAVLRPRVPVKTSSDLTKQLPFLFGVAAHLTRPGTQLEREAALMAALGFRACRTGDSWDHIQPEPDVWKWEATDRVFETLSRNDITVTPLLSYSTNWATTGDTTGDWRQWVFAPPKNAEFAAFAAEMVKRYGRYTRYWEVWNEPDISFWLGTAEQYAATFDAVYESIHRVQPDGIVMNGGFSEVKRKPTFIPDWQAAAKNRPDVFAYHSHMAYGNMLRASSDVKGYLKNARWSMPTWLNESGFSSVTGYSERDQAIALVKKMSSTAYLGFSAYFWYDMRDDGTVLTDIEHHFGLVRPDYTPKAAAVATHTLTSTLAGQRFVKRLSVKDYPQVFALVFEKPDHSQGTLVLWNEETAHVPFVWNLPGKAHTISMMGKESALEAVGNMAVLPAGPEPVFVEFKGAAQKLSAVGSFLEFAPEVTGIPGETVSVSVKLHNPLDRAVSGTLSWTAGGGWTAKKSFQTFKVPARAKRDVVIALRAPAEAVKPNALKLGLKTPQLPGITTAQIPLKTAVLVPRRPTSSLGDIAALGKPLAVLNRSDIVSLFEVAPLDNLLFRGDNDLNATMYMARVPEGLRVVVRVQDDVFFQKEAPREEWKGDSLQLGLVLPGGGNYEWVVALTEQGPQAGLTLAPQGVKTGTVSLPISIQRQGTQIIYQVLLPTKLPGGESLPDRFRFSFLVNDNDGGGRKGWIEWTPGIGKNKDPNAFRSLVIR